MNRRRVAARKQRLEASSGLIELPPPLEASSSDPVEQLIVRARKLRKRGELRRALVSMREAANRDEWGARTWTLLGALLADMGQRGEAAQAFQRARWLRARAGDKARVAVTEMLEARLLHAA